MKLLESFNRVGVAGVGWLGALCLMAMILHVTLDVTLRYLFNAPLVGTIMFVSVFYMVAVAFLPLAQAEQNDAQISVEVVTELMPLRVQGWLSIVSLVVCGIVFAGMAVRTWLEAMAKFRLGSYVIESGIMIPTWPSYFFLPIGFGLATLVAIRKLISAFTRG